jgi:hypothetical protein
MLKHVFWVFVVLSSLVQAASAQMPCHRVGDVIDGELRLITTRHPNGSRIEAIQLLVRPGTCMNLETLAGRRQDVRFRVMHLVSENPGTLARLRASVGHVVWVRSRDVMEAHTAWHQGDLVMFDVTILAVDPL